MKPAHSIPNLLTLARLMLVPVAGYFLVRGEHGHALIVFFAAAVTDFLDGVIARHFKSSSTLGATLDPIADKLNMFVATVVLAWQSLLPMWLAIAIVLRDVIIVAGALAYRFRRGHVEMAPTLLSKVNTFMEFAVLLLVMASAARWIETDGWLPAAFVLVFATVVASGAQYVWVWGRKAFRDSERARQNE